MNNMVPEGSMYDATPCDTVQISIAGNATYCDDRETAPGIGYASEAPDFSLVGGAATFGCEPD